MKNYKEYEKRFIGASDIAALILVGCDENGLKTSTLDFGEDGSYMAYVVDEDAEIGAHYKKVADFKHWLKIYDDDELTYRINAQEINISRRRFWLYYTDDRQTLKEIEWERLKSNPLIFITENIIISIRVSGDRSRYHAQSIHNARHKT